MEQSKKMMENVKEIRQNDWLMRMCDTATVENDKEFIRIFNRRFERFRELFINKD